MFWGDSQREQEAEINLTHMEKWLSEQNLAHRREDASLEDIQKYLVAHNLLEAGFEITYFEGD
jgi:hypothetical protein